MLLSSPKPAFHVLAKFKLQKRRKRNVRNISIQKNALNKKNLPKSFSFSHVQLAFHAIPTEKKTKEVNGIPMN